MRTFDDDEKQIIQQITHGKGYSRNFINLIDSRNNLQATRIEIDKVNAKASFLFQIQKQEPSDTEAAWGIEKQKQLVELIIKYVTLLRYLEKEELATFFDPAPSSEAVIEFGMGAVNMPSFRMSIADQTVVDLLIKYVHKEIMPSPALRALEKNKFISDEDRRFTRQQRVAWTAIIISVFLGLFGIYKDYQSDNNHDKIITAQIQEFHRISDSLIAKINELKFQPRRREGR